MKNHSIFLLALLFIALLGSLTAIYIPIPPDIEVPKDLKDLTSDKLDDLFAQFMKAYKKKYSSEDEEKKREGIFGENLKKIIEWNSSSKSATFGINAYTDLTDEEFKERMLMDKPPPAEQEWRNNS